ncbi:unnamed protein product [Didymodactylos carnosus]|uniref:Uncharacterized protein n=1 Tax=Didymodactylos carnosus TaxID=1234261 RepID=A0A815GFK8_9BILA|nr:unnamed protein product [Didymodactylos carnosus]CAF1338932.1 unnamed protein product [Didymodactylos carnosus]CAF3844504.1 unnamed protein product [Didymodactylos carnosus]CAF4198155.1 unnamed protein product [Didymodactylos carnosus]
MDSDEVAESKPSCVFFKKPINRGNAKLKTSTTSTSSKRKQESKSSSSSSDEEINVSSLRSNRIQKGLVTMSGAKSFRKNRQTDDDDEKLFNVNFESDRTNTRQGPRDQGATAITEIDPDFNNDQQSIFQRAKKINEDLKNKEDDKIYRGNNYYQQFYEKKDTAQGNASSGLVRNKGPIRAPAHLRVSVRWDYQPDICKDYKETGYCGFGDSCKFLHDRSDYKHGWQLEREWNEQNYGGVDNDSARYLVKNTANQASWSSFSKKHQHNPTEDGEDEDEQDVDGLPFRCLICRKSFKEPVVTKCRHYFCETCAIQQYRSTQKCFICNENTSGIFMPANDIIKKLKLQQQEQEQHQKTTKNGRSNETATNDLDDESDDSG